MYSMYTVDMRSEPTLPTFLSVNRTGPTLTLRARLFIAAVMAMASIGTTLVAAAPASAAPCTTSDPLFGGNYYCGYGKRSFSFSDGTYQIFVIGTDYSVWTRWRKSGDYSRWVDMGGKIRASHASADFGITSCGGQPILGVVGTNNRWYGNPRYSNGTWGGWVQADGWACD